MKRLFAAAIALSMLSVPAFADSHDQHGSQPSMGQNHRPDDHGPQNNGPQNHQNQQKPQYSYNGHKYDAVHGSAWNAPKGYDANRHWNKGQKLPKAYRDRGYVVDYRAYHLKQPPRGYAWVRADNNNVYLVSLQSGLITQIVLNLFY